MPAPRNGGPLIRMPSGGAVKAKTRAKLEKSRSKTTGTVSDPIRLYDKPFWFDIWFLVGVMLVVPDFLIAIFMLVKSEFSFQLAGASITGYLGLRGYPYLLVQTLVFVLLGSIMPVFIRRSIRRGKLAGAPSRKDPGFYADPIRKNSQRFWDGTQWTDELRAPYKRETGRKVFLCGVFFLLSLLTGLGSEVKAFNAEKVKQSYEASASLAAQLDMANTDAHTRDFLVSSGPAFADARAKLTSVVDNYPKKEGEAALVDGVNLVQYQAYAKAFTLLADQVAALSKEIAACSSSDEACVTGALKTAKPSVADSLRSLPLVQSSEQAAAP